MILSRGKRDNVSPSLIQLFILPSVFTRASINGYTSSILGNAPTGKNSEWENIRTGDFDNRKTEDSYQEKYFKKNIWKEWGKWQIRSKGVFLYISIYHSNSKLGIEGKYLVMREHS